MAQAESTIDAEDLAGVLALAGRLAGHGVDEVVGGVLLDGASMKASVTATEMLKFSALLPSRFIGMKCLDVGMVDPQDAHVGAAAGAALLDGLGGGVDDLEEGDRARRRRPGSCGRSCPWAGARLKSKPVPPPSLWTRAAFLTVSKMRVQRILDGQDEAGATGTCRGRRRSGSAIGHEILRIMAWKKLSSHSFLSASALFGLGDEAGNAAEQLARACSPPVSLSRLF